MRTDFGRRALALAALFGLLAMSIGSSAAYFTDAITYAQRSVVDIPPSEPNAPLEVQPTQTSAPTPEVSPTPTPTPTPTPEMTPTPDP